MVAILRRIMADVTPPSGDAAKQEKKDTVRITLPPRPVPPSSAGAAAVPGTTTAPKLPATVPAMPVVPKKETSRLKKTTGKVPGATKPAAPIVPPPTVRAQPVQAPTTVPSVHAPPTTATPVVPLAPASSAATAVARPTVKLQTTDIPKIPSPPSAPPAASTAPAPAPVPAQVVAGGPTLVDAILSFLVMVVSGVAVWLLLKAHLG